MNYEQILLLNQRSLRKMFSTGYTLKEIAEIIGVGYWLIWKRFKEYKILRKSKKYARK